MVGADINGLENRTGKKAYRTTKMYKRKSE